MKKNMPMMIFTLIVILGVVIAPCYSNNDSKNTGVTNNIAYIAKLAEQGDMKAQTDLGFAYGNGNGIIQDHTKARYWYYQAAKQGFAPAQFNLGLFYANGWGGDKNLPLARELYRKAAS